MMTNLFSMFDPTSNSSLNLNWLSIIIPMFFISKNKWMKTILKEFFENLMKLNMMKNLKNNVKSSQLNNLLLMITLFFLIFLLNVNSINSFIFAPTSHLMISMSMSLPMWLSMMVTMWTKDTMKSLTHLVPTDTPLILCPFMVIIETISNFMRPFTLSIRLSANMIAGHILIALMSQILNHSMISFLISAIFMISLICLEIAVALIQSYVFVTLLSLYLKEM